VKSPAAPKSPVKSVNSPPDTPPDLFESPPQETNSPDPPASIDTPVTKREPNTVLTKVHTRDPNIPLEVYLSERYHVPFDEDLTVLWTWCKNKSPRDPCTALYPDLDLKLIGPFKLLSANDESSTGNCVTLHMMQRQWWCPPEVLPLFIVGGEVYGYWRDSPDELPSFIVKLSQYSGELKVVASNCLDFVRHLCIDNKKLCNTFTKLASDSSIVVNNVSSVVRERKKRVVCTSLNKIGLVVPVTKVGKDELGYRPITMTDDELGKMLAKACDESDEGVKDRLLEPLDECVNYIQFANDECDPGMGYELGMSVFCHPSSKSYTGTVEMLLPLAYDLLQRPLYAKIMRAICAKFSQD